MIVVLLVLALVVAVVLAYAALTLIAAALHHGRHVREFDRDLAKACGYEAGDGSLRDLPAPGETIYTDHNVWLPRTPQLLTPSRQPTEAELDEWKARWHAAQGGPVEVLDDEDDLYDLCAGCRSHQYCDGAVESCCCTCGWGEDWDEEDENEEPDPFLSETPDDVRCCQCQSLRVTYRNYQDQPFCQACANGEGPDPGGHTYDRDIPDWVWLELGKHGPDAAVESIAARAEVGQ